MSVTQCWRNRPSAVVFAWVFFLAMFIHLAIVSIDQTRRQDPRPIRTFQASLQKLQDLVQGKGQGVETNQLQNLQEDPGENEIEEEEQEDLDDNEINEDEESNSVEDREEEVLRRKTKNYGSSVVVHLNTSWTSEMAAARQEEYTRRLSRVQNICKTTKVFQRSLDYVYRNIIWDEQDQLMWCPVLKSASTTWMQNFGQLAKDREIQLKRKNGKAPRNRKKSRQIYKMPDDSQTMIDSALKFFIVRHPFTRLLSAYRDKMLAEKSPDGHFATLQHDITKQYQSPYSKLLKRTRRSPKKKNKKSKKVSNSKKSNKKNNQKDTPPACEDLTPDHRTDDADLTVYLNHTTNKGADFYHPTFTQFLMRVRDDMHQMWQTDGECVINKHWLPYWVSCSPCQVDYTVVAKVETIDLDNEYIIQESGLQGKFQNIKTHSAISDGFKSSSEAIKHYFSGVPIELLREIVDLYEPDFQLFDYDPQPFLDLGKS